MNAETWDRRPTSIPIAVHLGWTQRFLLGCLPYLNIVFSLHSSSLGIGTWAPPLAPPGSAGWVLKGDAGAGCWRRLLQRLMQEKSRGKKGRYLQFPRFLKLVSGNADHHWPTAITSPSKCFLTGPSFWLFIHSFKVFVTCVSGTIVPITNFKDLLSRQQPLVVLLPLEVQAHPKVGGEIQRSCFKGWILKSSTIH